MRTDLKHSLVGLILDQPRALPLMRGHKRRLVFLQGFIPFEPHSTLLLRHLRIES